jgi:hypothetical protein
MNCLSKKSFAPMKKLFEAIEKRTAIVVLLITLLMMVGLNYLANWTLERIEEKARADQARSKDRLLKSVYGPDLVEDYSAVFSGQSVGQRYHPFVEYIERARTGRFVNVSNQGTRCHYSDRSLCTAKGGKGEIWLFGGSTTFGYSVKDNETIAAYLAEQFPAYRVVNFGAASYYSTLERIRFENLLTELSPPKAAVFIDGLNDFYYFDVPDKSAYSPTIKSWEEFVVNRPGPLASLKNDLREFLSTLAIYRVLPKLRELATSGKTPKADTPNQGRVLRATATQEQISKAIARLELNHIFVASIGDKLGITVLTVLQPIPTYGVGHRTSKVPREALNYGDHANSGYAYREMLTRSGELRRHNSHMLNLANLEIVEGMYVDTVHYTPLFCRQIALQIYRTLKPCLEAKKIQTKGTHCPGT